MKPFLFHMHALWSAVGIPDPSSIPQWGGGRMGHCFNECCPVFSTSAIFKCSPFHHQNSIPYASISELGILLFSTQPLHNFLHLVFQFLWRDSGSPVLMGRYESSALLIQGWMRALWEGGHGEDGAAFTEIGSNPVVEQWSSRLL